MSRGACAARSADPAGCSGVRRRASAQVIFVEESSLGGIGLTGIVRIRVLCSIATAATAAISFIAPPHGSAQAPPTARKGPPAPQGPTPRLANGRADFSGVWRPGDIFLI